MIQKIKIIKFIGRQLSRLKVGQSYYSMVMYSISAVGILKIAFPKISIWNFMCFIPIVFLVSVFIGYIIDKSSIMAISFQKSVEMCHRFLNKVDDKNNEFEMLKMEVFFEWIKSLKENKPLDSDLLDSKYKIYKEKWKCK